MGWFEDETSVYIAMEYFPLGDLYNAAKNEPPMSEANTQLIMHQLLEGLVCLHENGFAHRDMKPGVSISCQTCVHS